jgi:CO/xanthine dehydrogenase FAD-binding subunit
MTVFYRRLPRFRYVAPAQIDEAIRFLADNGTRAVPMAGGTDLIPNLKRREISAPAFVVDLKCLPGLKELSHDPKEGLKIGAMATIGSISRFGPVREMFPSLMQAASCMASPQVRNRGTFVGNICSAIPSADSAPPLLTMDASVQIQGVEGKRTVALEDFFTGPGQTALKCGEIVTGLRVSRPPDRSVYLKLSTRHSMDLAIVGVAASAGLRDGRFTEIRIALGAVAPTPIRAARAEEVLRDRPISASLIEEAARVASAECRPIDDHRASASYRRDMVYVLTRRALEQVLSGR